MTGSAPGINWVGPGTLLGPSQFPGGGGVAPSACSVQAEKPLKERFEDAI